MAFLFVETDSMLITASLLIIQLKMRLAPFFMFMGGARSGKMVGEHLIDSGIGEDEAVKRIIDFLEYCKVGKVSVDELIRIKGN